MLLCINKSKYIIKKNRYIFVICGKLKYEYDKYKITLHTFAETKFK